MTLQQAAQTAIDVQDACNSSGVARSMVQAMDVIRAAGQNVNQHPIVYLYLYKLMALNGHEPLDQWDEYTEAETACKTIAAASEVLAVTDTHIVVVADEYEVLVGTDLETKAAYDEYVANNRSKQ